MATACWFSAADSDADDVNTAASFTSVTEIVTVTVSVLALPSSAVTVTL